MNSNDMSETDALIELLVQLKVRICGHDVRSDLLKNVLENSRHSARPGQSAVDVSAYACLFFDTAHDQNEHP